MSADTATILVLDIFGRSDIKSAAWTQSKSHTSDKPEEAQMPPPLKPRVFHILPDALAR